jgi:hypothetical protein
MNWPVCAAATAAEVIIAVECGIQQRLVNVRQGKRMKLA